MAKTGKTEHSGDKGSQRKHGFWGKREEAKRLSRKQRRTQDKEETKKEESDHSTLRFEINPKTLPKSEVVLFLIEQAGISFPNWNPDRLSRAIKNSSVVVFVWDKKELVGFARAISDSAWSAYLNQIAVLPRFQKQGIGKQMIEHLVKKLGKEVSLVAHSADSSTGFYSALGFEPRSNVFRLKRKI